MRGEASSGEMGKLFSRKDGLQVSAPFSPTHQNLREVDLPLRAGEEVSQVDPLGGFNQSGLLDRPVPRDDGRRACLLLGPSLANAHPPATHCRSVTRTVPRRLARVRGKVVRPARFSIPSSPRRVLWRRRRHDGRPSRRDDLG